MILKSVWFCCMTLVVATCLSAQPALPGEDKEPRRRAWVVVANTPESLANPLPVMSGGKVHEVRLHPREIGDPIPVDKNGAIRVVKAITKPNGEIAYEDLARCVMAEGVREALIVLVAKEEDEEGLLFKSKVIDLSKFKEGGCLYVNLVKTKIGITIGEEKATVPPGGMEFINLPGDQKAVVKPIRFFYEIPKKAEDKEAEWKLMTASRMAIYRSRREICIFFYDKEIENVNFRGIHFITPPPKPRQP